MSFLHRSVACKPITLNPMDTNLRKCLSLVDLTLIGIGGMAGSGIYILTGVAAKEMAGVY